jgi:hypothetical protein
MTMQQHRRASSTEAVSDPEEGPPVHGAEQWRRRNTRLNSTTADNHKKQAPQAVFRLEPKVKIAVCFKPDLLALQGLDI